MAQFSILPPSSSLQHKSWEEEREGGGGGGRGGLPFPFLFRSPPPIPRKKPAAALNKEDKGSGRSRRKGRWDRWEWEKVPREYRSSGNKCKLLDGNVQKHKVARTPPCVKAVAMQGKRLSRKLWQNVKERTSLCPRESLCRWDLFVTKKKTFASLCFVKLHLGESQPQTELAPERESEASFFFSFSPEKEGPLLRLWKTISLPSFQIPSPPKEEEGKSHRRATLISHTHTK